RTADAGVEADSIEELQYKEHQRLEADTALMDARMLFDLRSAAAFVPAIWADWPKLCSLVGLAGQIADYSQKQLWWNDFIETRARERFFHWELEFPEVFFDKERPGFDVVLGNPPWDKIR